MKAIFFLQFTLMLFFVTAALPAQADDPGIPSKSNPSSRSPKKPAGDGKAEPSKSEDLKKKEPEKAGSEKSDEGEKKKEEKSSEPPVVTRPVKPDTPADPQELKATPNEQGRIRFNFSHQSWPDLLEWLARVSHLSLDWQELPGDYLNLHTQEDYSLEEAQNLINRHLLARGYTMLKSGEMLTVMKVSKLNAALVPRVSPAELDQRMDAEFVKVSFPLEWLLAERAAEELKPMLSPNGKLYPLKGVNRLEAMDAVSNLRDIAHLLQQSQSEEAVQSTVVREFRLKHRRASDVVLLVESILGLDQKRMPAVGRGGDMMSSQIFHQLQQMQQMMQQSQRGGNSSSSAKPDEPEPRLIVNAHENSILAHATPDKMEIIAQTIQAIDVAGDQGNQLLHDINRVKPYRLSTAEPQPIVDILKEMGNLSPQSRLQVDEKSRTIILFGTLADHYTTQTLIERLDGANRNFEVMPLRRLQADAVAGTIQYLMGAEEEDKDQNSNRSRYFYYGSRSSDDDTKKEDRPFRVDADIDNNRLLLWANDVELEEVRNLLIKMGETPPGTSNPDTVRTLDLDSEQDADRLLERLKLLWPDQEPNPLQIQRPALNGEQPADSKAAPPTRRLPPQTSRKPGTLAPAKATPPVKLAWWENERVPATQETAELDAVPQVPQATSGFPAETRSPIASRSGKRTPITIQRLPDGRIVYGSADTQALDRLEDMIAQLSPPSRNYHVFQLKYPTTWGYGIEIILKNFFEDKSLTEKTFDPWWGTTTTTRTNRGQRLSRQRELKIISDEDSHTILVQGATDEQLDIIGELIDVYDRPAANDPQSARKTEVFKMQYSQAATIADAVKQVYRDLLSANDPALQNPNQQQKPSNEPTFTYVYGRGNDEDKEGDNPAQPIKFKGLLSVGVDEVSNTVIVSAAEGLMVDIRELIENLDQAARPSNAVRVLQVHNLSSELIQQRLERTFSGPSIRSSRTGQRSRREPQTPDGNNAARKSNAGTPSAAAGSSGGKGASP